MYCCFRSHARIRSFVSSDSRSPAAASAPFQPAAFDCTALPVRVKAWLEMVLSRKRERHTNKLVELIARLP